MFSLAVLHLGIFRFAIFFFFFEDVTMCSVAASLYIPPNYAGGYFSLNPPEWVYFWFTLPCWFPCGYVGGCTFFIKAESHD